MADRHAVLGRRGQQVGGEHAALAVPDDEDRVVPDAGLCEGVEDPVGVAVVEAADEPQVGAHVAHVAVLGPGQRGHVVGAGQEEHVAGVAAGTGERLQLQGAVQLRVVGAAELAELAGVVDEVGDGAGRGGRRLDPDARQEGRAGGAPGVEPGQQAGGRCGVGEVEGQPERPCRCARRQPVPQSLEEPAAAGDEVLDLVGVLGEPRLGEGCGPGGEVGHRQGDPPGHECRGREGSGSGGAERPPDGATHLVLHRGHGLGSACVGRLQDADQQPQGPGVDLPAQRLDADAVRAGGGDEHRGLGLGEGPRRQQRRRQQVRVEQGAGPLGRPAAHLSGGFVEDRGQGQEGGVGGGDPRRPAGHLHDRARAVGRPAGHAASPSDSATACTSTSSQSREPGSGSGGPTAPSTRRSA
ncbi:MAG: hypothetical protein ACPF9W_05245, partial [Nocardioides sp.]